MQEGINWCVLYGIATQAAQLTTQDFYSEKRL